MRQPPLPLSIIDSWSIEQKLAVYDLCKLITTRLWLTDRDGLMQAMHCQDLVRGIDSIYDLDFPDDRPLDDDLPF